MRKSMALIQEHWVEHYENEQWSDQSSPVFSQQEEAVVKDTISQVTEWGYGFTADDFRLLIQKCLNDNNKIVPRFSDNLSGRNYVTSFR